MLITRPQKYKKSSNKPTRMRGAIILPPVRSRGGTYFDFNKKGKTIRAEHAASLAKCLVKNSVNIIYR